MTDTEQETTSATEIGEGPVPIGKVTAPLARDLARSSAEACGACVRPLAVRRIDRETGATTVVPIPCGATRASVCSTCADRARRLRLWQAREGWHLDEEPVIETAEPTVRQRALLGQRADLEDDRATALEDNDLVRVLEVEQAIDQADQLLRAEGIRGTTTPKTTNEQKKRRTRSTRRRQDAPDLPRHPVKAQTTGRVFEAPNGRTYRPSTFVTLTLPSYGPVRADGAPRATRARRRVRVTTWRQALPVVVEDLGEGLLDDREAGGSEQVVELVLDVGDGVHSGLHARLPAVGERDELGPAVAGVGLAGDVAKEDQVVDQVLHRLGGHVRARGQDGEPRAFQIDVSRVGRPLREARCDYAGHDLVAEPAVGLPEQGRRVARPFRWQLLTPGH